MSGKSLPDVGGGNALSGFPNGLGPPSKSSTSLVGFARLPLPPTMVNVPAGGGLLAGYLTFEIFSCLVSSVPAFATVAPADAKDPKFPAYFGAIIVDYDSKAAEGYSTSPHESTGEAQSKYDNLCFHCIDEGNIFCT